MVVFHVRFSVTLGLIVLILAGCGGSSEGSIPDRDLERHALASGDLRYHEFRSEVFENVRTLRVLVPEGYNEPQNQGSTYPVLYLNDGQNLFDSTTSVFNSLEWRVDETIDSLVDGEVISPIIVVGIDNAGRRDRFKEYFPYFDEYLDPPEPNPEGHLYPAFLIDEVIPFIEARYRVNHSASNRGLGGSSAGALAALYAVISRPEVFGRLLVESPSVYVDDARILKEALGFPAWPERIYIGAGTNEAGRETCSAESSAESELVKDVRRLEVLLYESGVDSNRVRVLITPCGQHIETAWAARFPEAMKFLYGK